MSQTERNRSRPDQDDGAARRHGHGSGNGRAHSDRSFGANLERPASPEGDDRMTSPEGDDGHGLTERLKRIYQERVEEPLPETFRSLVRRLRNGSNTGSP